MGSNQTTTRSQRIHSAHLVSWFIKGRFLISIGYIASNVRIAVNDKLGKERKETILVYFKPT